MREVPPLSFPRVGFRSCVLRSAFAKASADKNIQLTRRSLSVGGQAQHEGSFFPSALMRVRISPHPEPVEGRTVPMQHSRLAPRRRELYTFVTRSTRKWPCRIRISLRNR